jgi:predicted nucleic acid-binding protein
VVAADTSTISAYLGGHAGADVDHLDEALANNSLLLPPVVATALLSRPGLNEATIKIFTELPRIEIHPDYFERAGRIRREVRSRKLRARLADALIAQSCIDADVPLITRDRDFRHFAMHCGLKLV